MDPEYEYLDFERCYWCWKVAQIIHVDSGRYLCHDHLLDGRRDDED